MNLYERALASFRSGATDEAEGLTQELIRTSRKSGDRPGEIDGICMLARVELRRGDLPRVANLASEARNVAVHAKERRLERIPLHLQAAAARMQGNLGLARELYKESIGLNRELGEDRMVAVEHRNLAYVELHDGNVAEARRLFSTCADLAREGKYDGLEPYLLLDSAVLAAEDDDASRAAELLTEADATFAAAGQIPDPDDAAEREWLRQRIREMTNS
jgi:tetratricopeptide (TPR) repeat protein